MEDSTSSYEIIALEFKAYKDAKEAEIAKLKSKISLL